MSFITDTFIETSTVNLTSHTSDSGASWTAISGHTSPQVSGTSDNVYAGASGKCGAYCSAVPDSADYSVTAVISYQTGTPHDYPGIGGRCSTSAETFYHVRHNTSPAEWQLYRAVAGTYTLLDTWAETLSTGDSRTVTITFSGSNISVEINGVKRIDYDDASPITDAGRVCVRFSGYDASSYYARIDNLTADYPVVITRAFTLSKVGKLLGPGNFYYPCVIDTSGVTNWPWTLTVFASTDHGAGGIYMYGANGDPSVPGNWESYDTALAAGRFDAFGTKPASNPIYTGPKGDSETPHIVKIGSTYYLTSHFDDSGPQYTSLATATDAPLNFTTYSGTTDGKILPGTDPYPYSSTVLTGYFRWCANTVLTDIDYNYIGYGLHGGGDEPHMALWGSDDALSWDVISVLERTVPESGLPPTWSIPWNTLDPGSIRHCGQGEYVALVGVGNSASGPATRYREIYEVYFAGDGYTITREPRQVLARGTTGADDEYELDQPSTIVYNSEFYCFYQGADSSGDNCLMLAMGTVDETVSKGTHFTRENYDLETVDLTTESAVPANWTQEGTGTITFSANGMSLPSNVGVYYSGAMDITGMPWIEFEIHTNQNSGANVLPLLQIADSGPDGANNGATVVSYSGISNLIQLQKRVSDSPTDTENIDYIFRTVSDARHRISAKWDITNAMLVFFGNGRCRMEPVLTPATWTPSSSMVPRVSTAEDAFVLERLSIYTPAAGAGNAPTISTATYTGDTITFTLSEDCLGDGTGITIYDNSVEAAGTFTRAALGTITFTLTAGTFSGPVTYDISDTDIRSTDSIIAIQDVTGGNVAGTSASSLLLFQSNLKGNLQALSGDLM